MSGELTCAQLAALRWFCERGGAGVVDRYGRVVAGGEVNGAIASFLRLVQRDFIGGDGEWLRVTTLGQDYYAKWPSG